MEGECPHEPPRRGNGGRVSPRAAGTGNGGRAPHEPPGRAMEGECPHEPPSAVRKDGFIGDCGAPGGQASACPRTSRRSSLPPSGGNAAEPWKISASSSLCVKKTLNSQRSTLNSQRSAGVDARAPDCARTEHALDSHGSCRQPITHGAFYAPRLLAVAGGGDAVPPAADARVPSG